MIAVTGASGFVGTELIKQLIAKGRPVRALKRSASVIPPMLKDHPLVIWVEADMLDYASLEDAFAGVEHVYHCAAYISFDPSAKKTVIATNVNGTANVVNACLETGVKKLLHVSSVAALGTAKFDHDITEDTYWEHTGDESAYAISKHESEMEVWRGMAEGLDCVIVNPSLIFGRNSGPAGTGQIIELVRKGIDFYTDGSSGIVGVEDVAAAMILLMDSDIHGERFILNAGNLSYRELFSQIAKNCGRPAPNRRASRWMLALASSFQKIRSSFGGQAVTLTRDTINSAFKKSNYDNQKICKDLNFTFKPVEQVIAEACIT